MEEQKTPFDFLTGIYDDASKKLDPGKLRVAACL
jgi:hypothetical protein